MLKKHYEVIIAFLQDWLNWAGNPGCDGRYSTRAGLCNGLEEYLARLNYNWSDIEELLLVLTDLFINDDLLNDLNEAYPFGVDDYCQRYENKTQHLCQVRLAWVKDTIEHLQSLNSVA